MRKLLFIIIMTLSFMGAKAQPNNALSFSVASSQYVSVPHSASINLGSTFTIETWINYSGSVRTIIDKGNYDFLFNVNLNNDNKLGFFNNNTGAWKYSTGSVPQNTWTHVAITLSGGTLTFYINGVASGTAAITATQDGNAMNIGRQQPTACQCNHFNGQMDELRIWNIARTQIELAANYTSSIATNSSGLVAYYKFDEGTGSTLADATSNANNGTLQNSPTWVTSGAPVTPLPPTITSFTPISGVVGTTVTITGTSFNITPANNIVFFGATKATVTAATATSLTVTVPTGATFAPITVLNTGTSLAAYSLNKFNPVFSPAKTAITTADFSPKVEFTTTAGGDSREIAISDLNGDGKPDMVAAVAALNSISVFLNTATSGSIGSGSFAAKVDFATGTQPFGLAVGDITGDGKPDVVVGSTNTNFVSVLINTSSSGNLSFATKVDFATDAGPSGLALNDVDGDGKIDLAVVMENKVSVFRNTTSGGTISFAASVNLATGSYPSGVVLGDLDGDGKPDLSVAVAGQGVMSAFRNTSSSGSISFAARQDITLLTWPHTIAIGDLDADGKLDLALVNHNSGLFSVLRNTSSSGSIGFAPKQDFGTGIVNPHGITMGDLDGDGKPEIVTTSYAGYAVSVHRNTTSGSSINFATKVDFSTGTNNGSGIGSYGWAVAIGDLDGDGKPDLALSEPTARAVMVYRNAELPSNNADLNAMTISSGTLTPTFAAGTITYTASVINATTSVTVTPTRSDANATIQVRVNSGSYATVASGSASSGLSLNVGANSIDVRVTAQDGTTIKTYTITVTRAVAPGNALDFDGTNDYVAVGTGLSNLSNYTLEANVYYRGGAQWMMNFCNGTFDERIQFEINAGQLWCYSQSSAGGGSSFGGGTINTNTWYHVAMTNSTTAGKKLYINGVLVASNSSTLSPSQLPSGTYFNIGRIVDGYHFNGVFDDIRVWNVVRSASEISANMSTELVGNESGLRAYYKLNQGTAGGTNTGITTATDATSNGNNGTLVNFALTGSTSNWVAGVVAISNAIIWTGSTNTDWATANNWSTNAVPTSTSLVTIPPTVNAPNNTGTITIASLTVASGVTLTNSGTINVTGALTNAGTVNGSVVLNGSVSQSIAGVSTIENLALNNSAGATISSGNTSITGTLTVATGTLTTGGFLTLKSNATSTAQIAPGTGSYISGNVTVERYIPGGRRTTRFLGHPFSNALNMSSLIDDIYITGNGAGFDATVTNNASAFWFNNSGNTWTPFTSTSDASWTQYRGIRLLVRGDRNQPTALTGGNPTPNPVTLDMTGTVNTGNQNIAVPTGYSVISNPYPSAVNIGQRLFNTANIGTQYWVWDANAGPSAGAYVTKIVTNSSYNLAMNGAFVVEPSSATTINFVEADKTTTASDNLFRTNNLSGLLQLQVLYNNYPADNLYVRFNTSASDYKESLDGGKLLNPEVNIYALSADNFRLSLDTRAFSNNKIIPLGFTATAANTFTIKAADLGIAEEVYLKDKLLNVETKLDATTSYTFSVNPANANTVGENRFELVFRTSAALPTNFVSVAAQQKGTAIEVSFNTANETNMHSYEVEESKDGSNFTKGTILEAKNATTNSYSWLDVNVNNGNNYYRVKAIEKNGAVKYSQVVRVNIGTKRSEFTVYPNPVKGGTINLQLTDIEKGVYTVKVVNNLGQEIAVKQITHNGGSATQTISIGNAPTGKYNMVITNGTTTVTKTVIVD